MAPRFYRAGEGDLSLLQGKRIAVIGYGHLGSSFAKLLRASGLEVVVGNRQDESFERAKADGFLVEEISTAAAGADVAWLLVPDEVLPEVFSSEVAPKLRPGAAVCVSSGYCWAFGLIDLPPGLDFLMLAPRMMGERLAEVVSRGGSYVSYISVEQDATGQAKERLLALAEAVGALRRGALELSAYEEAVVDLFVEQTIGPYLGTAIRLAFALGVEAGLPPEALVLEMYLSGEMSQVFRGFAEDGFYASVDGHGLAAAYGGFIRTTEIDLPKLRSHFQAVLQDISSGGFAKRLQQEAAAGYPTLGAIRAIVGGDDGITAAEARVKEALGTP
jgi:ketol-acid reductoisomerase